MNGFDIVLGHNMLGFELADSIFDNHRRSEDQVAFECTGWGKVYGNYFEKTTGTLTGESLTTGTYLHNAHIFNNFIKRTTYDNGGISIEAFNDGKDASNVHISDNLLVNAGISVGNAVELYIDTIRQVSIHNNTLYNGGIRILGSPTGSYSNNIKDVSIVGNTLFQPTDHGIQVIKVAGPIWVNNNVIHNSNTGSSSPGANGLIWMEDTTFGVIQGNSLMMDANADTDVSPHGIKYVNGGDLTIINNRIVNRNATNPSYVKTGTQTGTNVISRSL